MYVSQIKVKYVNKAIFADEFIFIEKGNNHKGVTEELMKRCVHNVNVAILKRYGNLEVEK